jgi:hypothetical protein
MFWTANASVKSAAVTARFSVIGARNNPKLWRIPMPRVSKRAAPIKINRAWLPLGAMVGDILQIAGPASPAIKSFRLTSAS